nr:DUF6420 family protein [Streptomyces paludis]
MTTTEHRGAAGPYIEYDGLPVLHATETGLPLLHPYGAVSPGRYVTPGGGRLTIKEDGVHSGSRWTTWAARLNSPRKRTPPSSGSASPPKARGQSVPPRRTPPGPAPWPWRPTSDPRAYWPGSSAPSPRIR